MRFINPQNQQQEQLEAPRLQTERLVLRAWQLSDVRDLYEYARQPDVGPAAGWMPHKSLNDSLLLLREVYLSNPLVWAITIPENGRAIGCINLRFDNKRSLGKSYILGYSMSHDHWGKGYMPEAAKRIIPYAFEELNALILATDHFPDNTRSKRVIEKCGFRYEGTLRMATSLADGTIQDELVYSMTREEYGHLKSKGLFFN